MILTDLQKTTCFNNQPNQQRRDDNVTTQQPRPRANPMSPPMFQFSSPPTSPQQQTSFHAGTSQNSANINHHQQQQPSTSENKNRNSSRANPKTKNASHHDCDCSEDEMHEISEKRQSIFDSNATGNANMPHSNAKKTKLSNSSSIESSSFEEVVVAGKSEDDWLFVEKSKGKAASSSTTDKSDEVIHSSSPSQVNLDDTAASSSSYIPNHDSGVDNADIQRLMRRRSDSSLLSLRKSGTITIDASSINLLQGANEVKKVEISCRKCGKAKSKIKEEILKLSEQLKSSNRSAEEINAKINEFMEYLESNHASEMTEIEDTQANATANEPFIPSSSSHDEIEENIFDENEGINVYGSEETEPASFTTHDIPSSSTSTPRRFISLDDIHSR
jgi:hypothetical protein